LLTNKKCFSDLNHLSVSQQITQNNKLLRSVICSRNYLKNNKQLTCFTSLNPVMTSPVIAKS
jgi:Ran GTPase-activating protein (RanGAP) involved in mRNA processing and transport